MRYSHRASAATAPNTGRPPNGSDQSTGIARNSRNPCRNPAIDRAGREAAEHQGAGADPAGADQPVEQQQRDPQQHERDVEGDHHAEHQLAASGDVERGDDRPGGQQREHEHRGDRHDRQQREATAPAGELVRARGRAAGTPGAGPRRTGSRGRARSRSAAGTSCSAVAVSVRSATGVPWPCGIPATAAATPSVSTSAPTSAAARRSDTRTIGTTPMMPKNVAPAAHSARSLSGWERPMPRTSSRPTRRAPGSARRRSRGPPAPPRGPSASCRSPAPVAVTAGLSARPRLHNAPRRRPTTRGAVGGGSCGDTPDCPPARRHGPGTGRHGPVSRWDVSAHLRPTGPG